MTQIEQDFEDFWRIIVAKTNYVDQVKPMFRDTFLMGAHSALKYSIDQAGAMMAQLPRPSKAN